MKNFLLLTLCVAGMCAGCTGKNADGKDSNGKDTLYMLNDTSKRHSLAQGTVGKDVYQDSTSNASRLPAVNNGIQQRTITVGSSRCKNDRKLESQNNSEGKPSYLDFELPDYHWKPDIDYKRYPERYRVGKGEQGVLICEPYKSIIGPHWRFKDPDIAHKSAGEIYDIFLKFLSDDDFVGADMSRKYLQMGYSSNTGSPQLFSSTVPKDAVKDLSWSFFLRSDGQNLFSRWWYFHPDVPMYALDDLIWKFSMINRFWSPRF